MRIGKRSNWVVVTLRGGVGEGGSWGREPSSFNLASASVNEGGDEKRQDVKFTLADFVSSHHSFPSLEGQCFEKKKVSESFTASKKES